MVSEKKLEIEALIPHRDPFLFVDQIVDRTEDSITTEWAPSPDFSAFRGHFPGEPILPGVLISEFVFQSAAVLLATANHTHDALPVLTKIENARFRRIVRPGDVLRAHVTRMDAVGNARYMQAKVTCQGESVLRLSFVVAEVDPPGEA